MTSRIDAIALDRADPLASFRDEFLVTDPAVIYLDGNSLGMTPARTVTRIHEVVTGEWASGLIGSWDRWLDMPQRVGDRLAPLIGAAPGEVVVHDSTTVNLYQLVHAALALRTDRTVIAIDAGEFPTDRYVVQGIADATGRTVRDGFVELGDVAVVVRSVVDYRTAAVVDVAAETARARAAGALVVWDLAHAAGVLAVDLGAAGAELAVGCSYKFLNGGPGAPGWSYVAAALQPHLRQPIWGWFAHVDQFAMGPTFAPRPDIGRLLLGTPSILALTAADEGIALSARAGILEISAKADALTAFALRLCDELGLATSTPRDPARRGGHVAVVHDDARTLVPALAARCVITDFREPDVIRIGCSPLTTRFTDVYDGLVLIAQLAADSSSSPADAGTDPAQR
ncbi:MAG: putative kynureninase [Ilumatobacteraceae bacterium]|nr:putative kynureninase [Ilumatobacteraceae bacterium]